MEDMHGRDSGPSRHNSLLKQHRGRDQLFSWLQRQTGIVCQPLLIITLSAQPPLEDLGTMLARELLTEAQQLPLPVFMLRCVSGKQWADGGHCCSPMLSIGLKLVKVEWARAFIWGLGNKALAWIHLRWESLGDAERQQLCKPSQQFLVF